MLSEFEIVCGSVSDWEQFSVFHYRSENRLYFVDKVYLLLHRRSGFIRKVGIVVYSYPKANCGNRDSVLKGYFDSYGIDLKMELINREVRRLARVVINPTYRGAGLATHLVSQTMPMVGVRFIDTVAKMGLYSGFLEKAGMERVQAYGNYFLYDRAGNRYQGSDVGIVSVD